MIAGADLSAWLADPAAQRRSLDGVEACTAKWGRHPLIAGLDRELGALAEQRPEAILAAATRFLERTGDIADLMLDLIRKSAADPFFRPPFHPVASDIHAGLLVYHSPILSIVLGVTGPDMLAAKKAGPRGATSVAFTGQLSLYRFIKAGGATISFWEAPRITDMFVAGEAGTCRLVERRRMADGEDVVMDGSYQSFVIEHATSDMVYYQVLVRAGAAPVTAEFDSSSHAFVNASSTDEASSRVQLMVSLLRSMERDDALPLIEESLNNPQFYTRWHIMREFLAMDADAALPALRRMAADDPHPDVRTAAQQTLILFFDGESEAAQARQGDVKCRA